MNDQQNSSDGLMAGSQHPGSGFTPKGKDRIETGLGDNRTTDITSPGNSRSGLISFAIKLAYLPYEDIYTFIISQVSAIFCAEAVLISVFNDKLSELQVISANITDPDTTSGQRPDTDMIINRKIPLRKDQTDRIYSAPYHLLSDISKVSPDTMPQAFTLLPDLSPAPGWFLEIGFISRQKPAGTLLVIGSKNQDLPNPDDIGFLCGILSNAVARKLAEETLDGSEARLKAESPRQGFVQLAKEQEEIVEAIANYTSNWESWFDNSGKIIWTNPASFKYTGYTPAEIIALPDYIGTLVAENDRERVTAALKEVSGGKDNLDVEFQCVRKDQTRFMISVSWKHIYNKEGKALGIRTSGQDITNFRKAEQDFSTTESLYRQMIDNAPFGMHFYQLTDDDRLIFTAANHAANSILGIDHTQLVGLPIEEAFPSLKGIGIIEHYCNAARDNITWVTDHIVYSDNKISGAFEVKAFQTVPGSMVAIFSDITNRKQSEEALRESQQLFETLTRVSPVGIFRTNSAGATTFVNPKWTALTGLSFEDAMDHKYLAAIHPDDREERVKEWNAAVKKGKFVVSEYRFLRSDGSIIWVQGHAVPEIADGNIKGYIGTITDISELKRVENELFQTKEKAVASDRLKTTFMGNISHEIRTPLNGIIGFAEMISSGNNTPEENEECIEFLNLSINRLTRIIDNIMDLSMMMSGNTRVNSETFRLDLLINEVVKKYESEAAGKNLSFSFDGINQLSGKSVISDQTLIRRIFNELVNNAVKFTNKGSISIVCRVKNNMLSFHVQDSGIGISEQILPFIFEPFVQEDVYSARESNSNGLGLSIVNEAVKMLKGTIVADSASDSGTSIKVNLPVTESQNETESAFHSSGFEKENEHPVILVVEDEEINMIYLRRILKQKGYQLLIASNGPEAISYIEYGHQVDLILMDMKMPGMDGFETTRRIKAINPKVKIAAVTAYASDADRKECMEAGCDNYISKPFQKNDLYQLIKQMI